MGWWGAEPRSRRALQDPPSCRTRLQRVQSGDAGGGQAASQNEPGRPGAPALALPSSTGLSGEVLTMGLVSTSQSQERAARAGCCPDLYTPRTALP